MLKTETLVDLAKQSSAEQHKVAAAVYNEKGRLLSTGVNQPKKSHPLQAKYAKKAGAEKRIFLHAEVASLVRCREEPHTLHVVRVGPKEYPKPSCPCPVCQVAALEAGIKEVVYFNGDHLWVTETIGE